MRVEIEKRDEKKREKGGKRLKGGGRERRKRCRGERRSSG
mgnify:CR=1 FL=1